MADLPSGATPLGSPSPYRGRIRLLLGLTGACAAVLLAIAGFRQFGEKNIVGVNPA